MACRAMALRVLLSLAVLVTAVAQRPIPFKKEAEHGLLLVTPNIMTGILVGLLWVSLFLVGFCCLFQVQTPSTFTDKCLVLNKQY
eukprot:CAMPEP_0168407042 /NCGR_PEP_ID=MMETSP0228-20121227/25959_1 /TAXON_ID=133427 /ORGANISM="Protoceratium reticulatum, Strain CCCM 535 (=CCMP 1889)" /LENGTH=84 /DNA_ID=CAMNT_0008420701 /DNA_START=81 /DNA_END=335 /DNA_ORIENTATION=+